MANYKVEHDRANCIGCGGCVSIFPEGWVMDATDGKSDIIGSKMRKDGWEELDIDDKDFQNHKDAAEICPVNVIHLKNKETNEKII